MDELEKMMAQLRPVIRNKSADLKEKQSMERAKSLFLVFCGVILFVPVILVFLNVGLSILYVPIVFSIVALLILCPLLVRAYGGEYEKD